MTETFLVGIDGSESSRRAAEYALARAKASGGQLLVAHVIEWSPYTFNTPEENEQRHRRREEEIGRARTHVLDPVLRDLGGAGVPVEGVVRHGHAVEVLSGLAHEAGASAVVIGRIGTSSLRDLLFGSVASRLVQVAPVPVTVVP